MEWQPGKRSEQLGLFNIMVVSHTLKTAVSEHNSNYALPVKERKPLRLYLRLCGYGSCFLMCRIIFKIMVACFCGFIFQCFDQIQMQNLHCEACLHHILPSLSACDAFDTTPVTCLSLLPRLNMDFWF